MNGLENKKRVAYYEYDFAKHGGGPGDINLHGGGIPIGAVIDHGIIHVRVACTHASTGSIALKAIGANDIKAACIMASLTANALVPTVPVGTAATAMRVTTSINKLVMTVGSVGAMTAGKLTVALDYWITD